MDSFLLNGDYCCYANLLFDYYRLVEAEMGLYKAGGVWAWSILVFMGFIVDFFIPIPFSYNLSKLSTSLKV